MTISVSFQTSLGRFSISADENISVRDFKRKCRMEVPAVSHVNFNSFRANVNGSYLSDDSKSLVSYGVRSGDTIHLVKKSVCPNASVDTEKKADE